MGELHCISYVFYEYFTRFISILVAISTIARDLRETYARRTRDVRETYARPTRDLRLKCDFGVPKMKISKYLPSDAK